LKPLAFADQADATAAMQNDPFLFGDDILVSPVLEQGKEEVQTYLPEGKWYHYWDNEVYEGQESYDIDAPIERIPFFIREGTVLPLREVMQYTDEKEPKILELNVYYSDKSKTSLLYEDAEEGWEYKKGDCLLTTFEYSSDQNSETVRLKAGREGTFKPAYDTVEITLAGLPFDAKSAEADGSKVELEEIDSGKVSAYKLSVPAGFEEIVVDG
jgi:alpha-glucosidase